MPKVMLRNVQLTVEESKLEEFLKLGYSQIDEKGEIVKAGQATDLKSIKAENETLKAELAKYQDAKESLDKVVEIQAELKVAKAENEELKAQIADLAAQLEAANKGKAK